MNRQIDASLRIPARDGFPLAATLDEPAGAGARLPQRIGALMLPS